jgi:hypothetical protein
MNSSERGQVLMTGFNEHITKLTAESDQLIT